MCTQKLSFDYAHTLHTVRIVHNAHNDGTLTIIFGGGYEIEEALQEARSQDTEKTGGMRTLLQEFSLRGWYHILTLGSKGHLFEQFSGEKMRKI